MDGLGYSRRPRFFLALAELALCSSLLIACSAPTNYSGSAGDYFKKEFDNSVFPNLTSDITKPPNPPEYGAPSGDLSPPSELCYQIGIQGRCLSKSIVLSRLRTARYIFNSISEMFVGEEYDVSLVIDPSGRLDAERELRPNQGQIEEGITKVSLTMEAELSGATFDVQPKGRVKKELSVLGPTRWDWGVRPTAAGKRPLQLTLYVILKDSDGKKIGEDHPVAERRTIIVNVTWAEWASNAAKLIDPIHALLASLAASAAGFLGWLGLRKRGRRPRTSRPGNGKKSH
jgi:hypothetical protein